MKRITLLLLLAGFSLMCQGQYRKMPLDTNHIWQEYCNFTNGLGGGATNTFQLKVIKDSVVNGKTYKYFKVYNWLCGQGLTKPVLLRQDTVLKRVVFLNNNQEQILYNFNKNVGDTAKLSCFVTPIMTYTLNYKDSVLLSDGLYHKRFNFNSSSIGPGNIVEGVGCLRGLLWPYCTPIDTQTQLQCLTQVSPGMTIFSAGGVGSACPSFNNPNSIPEENKKSINIYPNPANNFLTINTGNTLATKFNIYDLMGQILLSGQFISDINIQLENFRPGMYAIEITTITSVKRQTFIVNN